MRDRIHTYFTTPHHACILYGNVYNVIFILIKWKTNPKGFAIHTPWSILHTML